MFVVTFYSYKGGVGRTSAMVNVASRLSQAGKKVVILDFDLEAPGIDAFPAFSAQEPRKGIVEYINHFSKTGSVAPIEDFVYSARLGDAAGEVRFMPAGRKDRQYQSDLSRLDWKMFYKQKKGFLFIENLKASIKEKFDPDYVLIDSRTGLTDVSGICTIQLPNLVVLLFSLNNQNLYGTGQIYRSVRSNRVNRAIATLLVASPIPELPDALTVRKERLESVTRIVGTSPSLILPYDPFVAFVETILSKGETTGPLSKAYDSLADRIVSANPADVITLLQQARQHVEAGNAELAELKFQEIVESKPKSYEAWLELGLFTKMRGKVQESMEYLEKAHDLNPNDAKVLAHSATTYLDLNRRVDAIRTLKELLSISKDVGLLQSVMARFAAAGELETAAEGYLQLIRLGGGHIIYVNLAEIYMRMRKFFEASEVYIAALKAFPSDLVLTYNAGYALKQIGDERAVEHFRRAAELFEQYDRTSVGPVWLANAHKAMGHAFAGIGKPERALQSIRTAIDLATKITRSPLYSSVSYTYVSRDQFIKEAKELIAEIQQSDKSLPM
jgi:tetratricopeptide (TPR) repeat protein/MinD-like ATPase involved in chromosome partitioning or flagellar assembly